MSCIVFYSTRPITSKYTKSLVEQMAILRKYQESGYRLVFMSPYKSTKAIKYIEDVAGIKIDRHVSYKDHYDATVLNKKYNSWHEYIDSEFFLEGFKETVKEIFLFGGLLSETANLSRFKSGLNRYLDTQQFMNFLSIGQPIAGVLQLIRLSRESKINLHEICYDVCENSVDMIDYKPYNYTVHHGYDIPRYNIQRLDSLQYYIQRQPGVTIFGEKSIDITLGFTVLTKRRVKQYDTLSKSLESFSGIKYKFYLKHKYLEIDTFVDRNTYLNSIKDSNYTLIIPPYDPTHFSIFRFIESVHYDCLPLIASDVNINEFAESFDIDMGYLQQTVVDYDEIPSRIHSISEEVRQNLLSYFKEKVLNQTKGIKQL